MIVWSYDLSKILKTWIWNSNAMVPSWRRDHILGTGQPAHICDCLQSVTVMWLRFTIFFSGTSVYFWFPEKERKKQTKKEAKKDHCVHWVCIMIAVFALYLHSLNNHCKKFHTIGLVKWMPLLMTLIANNGYSEVHCSLKLRATCITLNLSCQGQRTKNDIMWLKKFRSV